MNQDDKDAVLDAISGLRASSTGWIYAICPFCSEYRSSKRRLSFNVEWGWFRCWNPGCIACSDRGFHISNWVSAGPGPVAAEARPQLVLPEEFKPLSPDGQTIKYGFYSRKYYTYLQGRGLRDETIIQAGIGYAEEGRYAGMVIVPVYINGRLEGYAARSITGKRFLNSKSDEGGKRAMLNGDALFAPNDSPLYLVEGPFDCLRHWPYAMACLGKPTHEQVDLLMAARRQLYIVLDADAWAESWALAVQLRMAGVAAWPVYLPSGTDPGKTSPQLLAQLASEVREDDLPEITRTS